MRYARCASALSLFLWFEPRAGEARSPNALAVRTPRPIALDGRLDESTWKEAPAVSGLTQWEPQRGQPATLDMEVKVLYDDAFVYVGAWLPKPAAVGPVIGHLHRRDQWSASDWFEVNFDTMHDHWNAYQFYVNPANVQMDVLLMGTSSDDAWDAVWESATQVHEGGWSVEARFPLSIFRIQNGPGAQTWGFNFGRQEPLTREIATWVVPPREVTNLVSVFGELDGFDGLKSGTRIELLPYLSPMRRLETSEPWAGRRWAGRAGVDARLGFGASELNLALNPDFGQVEVDQAVLNLSTVETFFQEKRPFFTQGMEVFNNNLGPVFFYSRRIGSALPSPSVGEAERLVERPLAADVMGALKYTGRFDGGRTLGILAAATQGERARITDAAGRERRVLLAPQSTYGALSVIQPLGAGANRVSGFFTYLNQNAPSGREALVAAIDGALQSRSGRFNLQLLLAGSKAGPKSDRRSGHQEAARLYAGLGKGGVLTAVGWNVSREYDANDVGYISRPDQRGFNLSYVKTWDQTWGAFRNWNGEVVANRVEDQGGRPFVNVFALGAGTDFTNQWSASLRAERSLPVEDDRELRSFGDTRKKYLRVEGWSKFLLKLGAPHHWRWRVAGSVGLSQRPDGLGHESALVQTLRPSTSWLIGLETRYKDERGYLGYVTTAPGLTGMPGQSPGIPVVGLRRLSQVEQLIRVSHTFSTKLSLQVFLQGLAASWAFRDLQHYRDDRTLV